VRFDAKGPSPLTADLSAWAAGPARWRAFGAEGFPDHRGWLWRKGGRGRAAHRPFACRPLALAHARPARRGP
jgi:hypothetical protein